LSRCGLRRRGGDHANQSEHQPSPRASRARQTARPSDAEGREEGNPMKANPEIEDRLRTHLAAEREAIPVPADLETRVLRRLEETPVSRRGAGMFRQLLLAAALIVFAAGLAFGVARLRAVTPGPVQTSPTPTPSASATATPSPIASPRPATATEYADMVAVGKPAAERQLGIADCGSSSPGPGYDCFAALVASEAMVGTDAGYFHGSRFGSG